MLRHREMVWLVPVLGYLAGFLPWLINTDRQMYLFYATALAPFLIIGIALVLGQVSDLAIHRDARAPDSQVSPVKAIVLGRTGQLVVVIYLVLVVAMFLFFLPVFTGIPLSPTQWGWRMWLPGWT